MSGLTIKLDDSRGPIDMPELEGPFTIFPVADQPFVLLAGYLRLTQESRRMEVRIPISEGAAMELLGLLDGYRQHLDLPFPKGSLLRPGDAE